MTVRVERVLEVPAAPEAVWAFIADPERRARAISVVEDVDVESDGSATWHVRLPIPVLKRTIAIETEDRQRDPPRYVEFVGRSRAMRVVGEHELAPSDDGTTLTNRFVVDGSLPGVERFFESRLDDELTNLETALRTHLGLEAEE